MKAKIFTLLTALATFLAPAIAFASGGRVDDSGMFVWAFLGFCATIVVAQITPAILMMTGLIKGIVAKPEKVTLR